MVTLETHHDPTVAGLRRAVLEDAGIVVATPGLEHRALLGMVGSYIEIKLQVRRRDLEQARGLLEALDDPDEILEPVGDPVPPAGVGPYRGGGGGAEGYDDARLKRVSAFCSLVLTLGTGHFYARESNSGWLILLLEVVALVVAANVYPGAVLAVPMLVLYDLFGGFAAVDRYNAGKARSPADQLRAAPILLVLWGLAVAAGGPVLDTLAEMEREQLEQTEAAEATP